MAITIKNYSFKGERFISPPGGTGHIVRIASTKINATIGVEERDCSPGVSPLCRGEPMQSGISSKRELRASTCLRTRPSTKAFRKP